MAQDEKYALITGSSRGIGRGIALALAENSVKVAIHFCQNETAARDTLTQVRQRGSDGVVNIYAEYHREKRHNDDPAA